ncbi:YpjP family protein [Sporosarcina sp. YIM B06819]|uniref:YpjP family protein n=1 Tax=Sporosarcina sp. YIM B06819 TaxID=3081769 RepID=UPI00298CA1DB|nr:YpjP family protein [Sporosarcina sp. YIM B06819]
MKKWLQKTLIVAVAFLTLGAISPNHQFWTSLQEKDQAKQAEQPPKITDYSIGLTDTYVYDQLEEQAISEEESLIASAKELSYAKFGTKIGPVIADEFDEVIFPKIEEAIYMTFESTGNLHKRRLAITEKPAGDYAEKIFNVYDVADGKDVIRFHVRTEKRPQDGYFYNFHYHTAEDSFVAHHSIGDIYWSKNTPPKWLS